MSCEFCGQALSGLAAGLVSLLTFIIIPIFEILLASLKILYEKVGRKILR